MSFTYNKRMSNYQSMLPITPNNFHLKHHNIRGGDFTFTPSTAQQVVTRRTIPTTQTPAITPSATPVIPSVTSAKLATTTIPASKATTSTTIPASPAPPSTTQALPSATPLPQTVQDWQNMSDDELRKLTPKDINNLSDASFNMAFGSTGVLGNTIIHAIEGRWNDIITPAMVLMKTAVKNRQTNMSWWISPNDPLWQTQLEGIPKFWLQHPNQYGGGGKSQLIMYNTYEDFQDTSFYKKYNSRIKSITPPRKFARYMNSEIPGDERNSMGAASSDTYLSNIVVQYGQKWRVMFWQGDLSGQMTHDHDYYVYYIDSTGLSDYLDMLEEFYNDRDTLQPGEVVSMLHTKYMEALFEHEQALIAQGYSEGEAAQKAKDSAAQETSEDNSSDIWGDVKDGLEIGAMFL